MRGRPAVEVVISSSWRVVHPLDEIQSYFSQDLQDRIIGATPQLLRSTWSEDQRQQMCEREVEVALWLEGNGIPSAPWIALDDMADLFSPMHPRLVLCDGDVGLRPDTLRQLDHLLNLDVLEVGSASPGSCA